jgi:hypothetical protein
MPPISKSPLNPLQKAIFALLAGDAPLTALLGGPNRVRDYVPEGQAYPYVRVGESTSTQANDMTSFGRSVVETIHVWTRARGNASGQDIAGRITELLDHRPDALTLLLAPMGHRVVSIRGEFDQALTDPDPEIRHHVLRFRVETAQTA